MPNRHIISRAHQQAYFGRTGITFSDRLAAGCLRKQPAGGKEAGGCLFFQPTQWLAPICGLRSQESVRINRQLRSPISLRGHLAPLSRRSYQPENRLSSVSRPFLNVSGTASPLSTRARISPNNNDRPGQARLRMDYALAGGIEREGEVGSD